MFIQPTLNHDVLSTQSHDGYNHIYVPHCYMFRSNLVTIEFIYFKEGNTKLY
jgi:hypothetical protein